MAINFIPVQCPSCGGEMMVDDQSDKVYCSYCRKKFVIQNDNEHINKNFNYTTSVVEDRAAMMKAEADLEKHKTDKANSLVTTIVGGIISGIVKIIIAIILGAVIVGVVAIYVYYKSDGKLSL